MKATVLLSGGLDSATCLAIAVKKYGAENVVAVSIFYGQRHARELDCAKKIAAYYGVKRYEFDAAQVMAYSDSALMNSSEKVLEKSSYGEQVKKNLRVDTYVPFRNGLMLSMAASFTDGIFQGAITFCAGFIEPFMTEVALKNLSFVGNALIFCVGINLMFGNKIRVANLLPSLIIAVLWNF